MNKDERLYAFIVARTSRSRARIRRISIRKRWLKATALMGAVVLCAAGYGLYGLTQSVTRMRIEEENNRLRLENEIQRRQLQKLENRVDAIEDTSRRLSEEAGVAGGDAPRAAGGPLLSLDAASLAVVAARAALLEENLKVFEAALRERARVPSIWPVEGESTDGFGVRGNPFGGGPSEYHSGQDISAPRGTPVVAPADGTVTHAGWQSGYGNLVTIDHGNGLSTRYGHLSKVEVVEGQEIRRGELLGLVGSTGRSTGPHLHYEVRIHEEAVSPRHYLPERPAGEAQKP
ncbi:MAG TPA: M23 family metallopeptidase [Pyrinomonadaceae bacterium]|nr:M23 family metallopeptidase [Pyrinomonadaceae bacterium]